ncbi:serine/arginine repetitive matrix protein 3-like [Lathamus discolor]|uniref:serine/arginine repetitive matrix protein 3-like n=1 Tax=Lathamus discolor TaxID=678569 RepID=UPI0032B79F58
MALGSEQDGCQYGNLEPFSGYPSPAEDCRRGSSAAPGTPGSQLFPGHGRRPRAPALRPLPGSPQRLCAGTAELRSPRSTASGAQGAGSRGRCRPGRRAAPPRDHRSLSHGKDRGPRPHRTGSPARRRLPPPRGSARRRALSAPRAAPCRGRGRGGRSAALPQCRAARCGAVLYRAVRSTIPRSAPLRRCRLRQGKVGQGGTEHAQGRAGGAAPGPVGAGSTRGRRGEGAVGVPVPL